jgi:AraC family transcriptional regulator
MTIEQTTVILDDSGELWQWQSQCQDRKDSFHLPWDDFYIAVNSCQNLELPPNKISNFLVSVHRSQQISADCWVDNRWEEYRIKTGSVSFQAAESIWGFKTNYKIQVLNLCIAPQRWNQALTKIVGDEVVELVNFRGKDDPLLARTVESLYADMLAECPQGKMYGEVLVDAIVAHLLRHYRVRDVTMTIGDRGGLSPQRLQKCLDYIEAHLEEDIPLQEMAELVGMSQYHFARMFKQSVSIAPHQYIIQQRIERAKKLLLNRNMTILEVSKNCGFNNPSHFNRHFVKIVNMTPSAYRKK